jgi:hypothetical protein
MIFHRARAAFSARAFRSFGPAVIAANFAISLRRSGLSYFARALPPLLPNATAAGFLRVIR